MALQIRLTKNNDSRKNYRGKWFGRVVSTGEVDTRTLARNISASNSVTESDVRAVIAALVVEMKHQMQDGKTVVLDDFGRFHLAVKSDMVDKEEDFNLKRHIRRIVCHFTPAAHRNQMTRKLERDLCDGADVVRWKYEE